MLRVMDLLRLPSLAQSYVAAGGKGIYKDIRKLEVLEESYPAVVRFLTANEFYLTNFWSLATNKEGRIGLIKEMIDHRCAGIGIMPGVYLDDIIDDEILELANAYDFPIVSIPSTARWGDIISEYGILASGYNPVATGTLVTDVLDIFSQFHVKGDVSGFCRRLSKFVELPLIISTHTVFSYNTEGINVAVVISKVKNILQSDRNMIQSPIMMRIDNDRSAVIYLSKLSMVIACVSNIGLRETSLQLFHQIAPYILQELNKLSFRDESEDAVLNLKNYADIKMHIMLVKGPDYSFYEGKLERKYLIYERDSFQKYLVLLIPETMEEKKTIYQEYQEIQSTLSPKLMVFSQQSYSQSELVTEITQLKYLVNSLSFLEGIFCIDELPLIFMLTNAPQEYDARIFASITRIDVLPQEAMTALTTMRLYLVLHNLSHVAKLLGIHVNSVKYRLTRALEYLGMDEDLNLNELPFTRLLMTLEHFNAENR